jgi:hypothetical protein
MTQSCLHCGSEFTPSGYRNQKYCQRSCGLAFNQAKRQQKHRQKLNEVKLKSGCVECGFNSHPAALQFNHRDPEQKSFEIGSCVLKSWESIEAEIAKCDVLCANCHSIHTVTEKHYALSLRHRD